MADRYWVGGTAIWDTTAGTKWATTSGGAGGASVPTVADSVFFDQASTYTVTMTGALACLNMNVTAGTVSFVTGTTPTLTVAGNWSTIAGTVWSQTGLVTFTATTAKTINTNGVTISSPFTFNGTGGSWTLQNNLTLASTATTTLTAGTLALDTYTLSTGLFASASAVARTINFGTGKIVTTSATTSTVWNTSTITNLTISGTSLVECQGGGAAVTKTISAGALSEANAINFSLLETTGTVTYAFTASNTVKNLIVNGLQTISNIAITIYGIFTHLTTNGTTTFTGGTNAWTYAATSGSQNITTISDAGINDVGSVIFNGGASADLLSFPASSTAYNLSGASWTVECWIYPTVNTFSDGECRFLMGGTNGTASAWKIALATNYSINFSVPNTGAISTGTAANSIKLNKWQHVAVVSNAGTTKIYIDGVESATSATVTKPTAASIGFKIGYDAVATVSTQFSGFISEVRINTTTAVYTGAFTPPTLAALATSGSSSSAAYSSTTNVNTSFAASTTTLLTCQSTSLFVDNSNGALVVTRTGSPIVSIASASVYSYNFPWIFGSASSTATWTLVNNTTLSRQVTLVTGTLDFNNKILSSLGFTINNTVGTSSITNTGGPGSLSLTVPITHTTGTLTLPFNLTTTNILGYTFTAGTLSLSTFTLTTPAFSSTNANARTIAFGTGKIVISSTITSTVWTTATVTNLSVTGTSLVEFQGGGTGVTKTINTGTLSEAQAINFSLIETTGTATYTFTAANVVKNLIVNGVQTISNIAITIYGDFTHTTTNGTTTFTAGANAWTFAATSGSYNITNIAGFTYDFPWTFGSAASTATWTIANNLTLGATRVLTFNTGTLDWNNKTLTGASGITKVTGSFTLNNTGGTTFNANALAITHTSGNLTLGTNLTTTAATGYTLTAGTLSLGTFTLTTPVFLSNNANVRGINYGTGQLALTGNAATIFDITTATSFTTSGTIYINSTYAGATGTRTFVTGFTLAQSVGYDIATSGTAGIVISPSATDIVALTGAFEDIDLTGFTGTLSNTARTVYGNLTIPSSGGTFTAGTLVTTFAATTSKTITTNARTLDFPFTFNGVGGTWTLQDALTSGTTRTTTLTNGTLNLNSFTHTTGFFSSSGAVARTLAFGTGQLALAGSNATIFDVTTATLFTTTGTPYINCTYASSVGTRTIVTGFTEAQAVGYDIATSGTAGIVLSPSATDIVALTGAFEDINLTGFVGTLSNTARTIYGSWTTPSTGGTYTAGTLVTTFAATSSKTITSNGRTLDFPFTFNGTGGTWALQDNFTSGSTRTLTLTAGTLNLNNFIISTGFFSSISAVARTLAFGTGQLTIVGSNATIFDVSTATNFATTGTVYINCTYASSVGTRTITTGFTEAQASAGYSIATSGTSGIILSPSATDIVVLSGSFFSVNLTGFIGTLSNIARTIYGSWTNPASGGTYTAGVNATTFASTTSQTITGNGRTIDFPITFNGVGGSWAIQTAFTTGATRTTTLTAGTLNLNNYTYTTQIFSSSGAVARTLAFSSTGQLALVGSGTTIFDITTATNFSTTGTVYVNSTYALSVGTRTFVTGFTEVQADAGYSVATSGTTGIVLSPSATDIVALTGSYNNINLTGFIGTLSNTARTVYGNWTNPASGGTYTAGAVATSFRSTSSQTITTNGRTLDFALTFDGAGGTWTLQDNLTIGATRILTWNNGTLDLNNFALSNPASITISGGATGLFTVKNTGGTQLVTKAVAVTHTTGELNLFLDMTFAAYTFTAGTITLNSYTLTCTTFTSTSTTARTFAFGTGNITVTASGACFNMLAATNHVVTGTPNVNITNSTATATSVVPGVVTEAQSLNFIFSGGAYALTFLATASHAARSITFSGGWAGTWAAIAACTVYGSLTLVSTLTLTVSASAMTFGGTSGTKTITTATKTIPFPLTFNGIGSTFQLVDSLTTSAAVTLTNGTFDGNNQTISGVTAFSMVTGTATIQNVSTALAFTLTSGTLNLGSACSFGAYTFTATTLNLSSYTLTCTTWISTSTTARTLAFGTGNITVTASGACFNMLGATNITVTGTPNINITNSSATATSVVSGVLTEAQSMNFIFSGGAYTLTFLGTASHTARDINFTNFVGTWAAIAACTVYGNVVLGASMTYTSSASALTLGATSSKTITTNYNAFSPVSIPFPITFNGVGGSWALQDTLQVASTVTLTAGTLNLNGQRLSPNFFSASGSTARNIIFSGISDILCLGLNGTLFTTATATNLTVTGTPNVVIYPQGSGAVTVASSGTEAQSFNFSFYEVAPYTLTFLGTAGYSARNVDFSNFTGTLAATSTGTIYGSVILNGSMTLTTSASAMTLGGTSGIQTFDSNGKAIPFPINLNASGATKQLTDAFTLATVSTTFTHTNGTLDLNGYTATVGLYTTATGTKNLTFTNGTLVVAGSGVTAFNNAVPTGYTTTDASGTGKISLTSSTAKTFVGGGSTYNCAVSHDGTGILTFTGSSSFRSLTTGVAAASFIFTIATTQTVTSWDVNGTAGNLVVINSSVAGTLANISKTGGGGMDYVSIADIAFQPCSTNGSGALPMLWAAGANSTNRGNNFGIVFEAYDADARTYAITLTSVTSWTLPIDWNPSDNTIHLIGGGGGGAGSRTFGGLGGGPGGGGGGYTKILNYSSAAGTVVSTTIGAAGAAGSSNNNGGAGGSTVFGAYSAGGGGAGGYGTGGAAGTGSTYNGGRGGLGSNYSGVNGGSGGGGGAGGPNGAGGQGGDNYVTNGGATGGGGNGGGYPGTTSAGGNGWLNTGGGASTTAGTLGTGGGAGPSGAFTFGRAGGSGFDIYGFIGGGGGGGGNFGGSGGGPGGAGGNYGAGGAGAGLNAGANPATYAGGAGAQGLIVIRYYVSAGGGIGAQAGAFFAFF